MASPGTQSDDLIASASLQDDIGQTKPMTESSPQDASSGSWMNLASMSCAGISGIGLLVVLFGVYLTPSDLLIVIGAGIMGMAAMGWVIVALVMIGAIVRGWFTFSRKSDIT